MRFDIITIFPKIFDAYFNESILSRASKKNLINIEIHNLRDYAEGKHKKVDDTPYGGGAGMVMKVEPIYRCVKDIASVKSVGTVEDVENEPTKTATTPKTISTSRTILFSAKGKKYTQKDAERLSKYENLIMICGRYEGVDERVAQNLVDEEISIGEYVLTGGEIPAMILVDSISRLIPGVLGNPDSLSEESFGFMRNTKCEIQNTELEYPQYTKPEEFMGWKVPKILLSGNHEKIEKWRKEKSKKIK